MMNRGTLLLLLLLLAAVFLAVRSIRRHKTGCCGDCSGCRAGCSARHTERKDGSL